MGWKAAIPLLLIGGPRIYGCWHFILTGLLQHGGLAEDVLDHRLNSRTVYMNPVSRFIYMNMNCCNSLKTVLSKFITQVLASCSTSHPISRP